MAHDSTLMQVIQHQEVRPVPYTIGFEGDIPERLDAYYGSPDWRGRIRQYFGRGAGLDTVRQFAISATEARDAFGGVWSIDHRPFYLKTPPMPEPSFDGVEWPAIEVFTEPVRQARDEYAEFLRTNPDDGFHMIGMGWGLFEQTWRLRGFENVLQDAAVNPEFYEELLDRLTDLYVELVNFWKDVPADGIFFGDDWGDQRGVILGPDRWRHFIKPRWARVYDAVHAQGKLAMSHCCGSVVDIMPDIIEIGLDVLESVQPEAKGMNPYDLKKQWGDQITFWGCVGTQQLLPFATPDEIRAEVKQLKREMGRGGGYILAPAKGLQPETPTENAVAALEAFLDEEY